MLDRLLDGSIIFVQVRPAQDPVLTAPVEVAA